MPMHRQATRPGKPTETKIPIFSTLKHSSRSLFMMYCYDCWHGWGVTVDCPTRSLIYWTSIPLINELLTTEVNVITYWPVELAFSVNCSMTALFLAPAAAKISKLVNTCVPLMLTLKVREPAAEK